MEIVDKIREIAESHLTSDEFFIVDIKASVSKIQSKVTILLDKDSGIGIDDLTNLSRDIEAELEEIMPTAFTLEVSSPGVDTPLKSERQFRKNLGREVKAILLDGTTLEGVLTAATPTDITLTPKPKKKKDEPQPQTLPLDTLKQAKVIVSFK